MKLSSAILIVVCLHFEVLAHGQKITLNFKSVPLLKVFESIKLQTGATFLYEEKLLSNTKPIDIQVKDAFLDQVLNSCLTNQPLTWKEMNGIIIISKKIQANIYNPADSIIKLIGSVFAVDGSPIGGASITIVETNQGTISNANGQFNLKNVSINHTLKITSIGFEDLIFTITGKTDLRITLSNAVSQLDEAVIIGYGSTTKRLNPGNIGKISDKEISKQPAGNILLTIPGRIPGVNVQQSSGLPGSAINVQIRGQNSIAASNRPFYIIDGLPFESATMSTYFSGATGMETSPFNVLNPSEIESIEVLKDADATAIYGSRGANGVILITTKKGKSGKSKLDIDFYSGAGKITRSMDLLDTKQYISIRKQAFQNDNMLPRVRDYDINGTWDSTMYTDWQKTLIGHSANLINAQINVSGGNVNSQYLFGGGYQRQGTVMPGNFYDERLSCNTRFVNFAFEQKLKADISFNYSRSSNNLPQYNPMIGVLLPPNTPKIYNIDGSLNWQNNTWANPMANFSQTHDGVTNNIRGKIDLTFEISPNLSIKINSGITGITLDEIIKFPKRMYNPIYESLVNHEAQFSNNKITTWITEPQINFTRNIGKGNLNIMAGGTLQRTNQYIRAFNAKGFASESLMESISAAADIQVAGENEIFYNYKAAFARVSYKLNDQYILNFTGRRDGSTRFGRAKQFANFYAIGGAWIFSKANLLKNIQWLNYGKLRISYGQTGSDGISDYGFMNTYKATVESYLGVNGLSPVRLSNTDYSWEINKKMEVGMEFGFLQDRILFSTSYYRNRSSNQLVGVPLPGTTGFRSIQANLPALVQNTGIEVEFSFSAIKARNFTWLINSNITIPRNKLITYPGIKGSSYEYLYEIGKRLDILKLYHFQGVDQQTGIYGFQDINNDGEISYPGDILSHKFRGQRLYGGINNTFIFKGFELSMFIHVVNQTALNYLDGLFRVPGAMSNQPNMVLTNWTKPDDIVNFQKYTQSSSTIAGQAYSLLQSSDAKISNASFVRIKNISLSYQLATKAIKRLKFQQLKCYVQTQNIFTFTNYLGWDPETQGSLPPLKMITAGFHITL